MDNQELINQIIDKIDSVNKDYKKDRCLSPDTKTWVSCALTEVKIFVQQLA